MLNLLWAEGLGKILYENRPCLGQKDQVVKICLHSNSEVVLTIEGPELTPHLYFNIRPCLPDSILLSKPSNIKLAEFTLPSEFQNMSKQQCSILAETLLLAFKVASRTKVELIDGVFSCN